MANLVESYRLMLLIRRFEETIEDLFARGQVRGTTHASCGQEAVAVGACNALRPDDYVTSTHRGHGHFMARGADVRRMMAELFGREAGYSRGRGGSQFMADFSLGFIGGNGITGGSIPVATGLALSAKLRRTGRIAACFFGDGASNQGTFHESLNMAGLWKLPVVYVCENNLYAMSMPICRSMAVPDVAGRAAAYGFPGVIVDGNDLEAVQAAVAAAAERARRLEGPTLLECRTYRFCGHSRGDPRVYRTREEEAAWSERDPIPRLRAALLERGLLSDERDRELRRSVEEEIEEAVRFARAAPDPDPATVTEGVFA